MPDVWLQAVERGDGQDERTRLSPEDQGLEYLLMGLRLTEGVDFDRLQAMFGRQLEQNVLQHLTSLGKIERFDNRLRATAEGRIVLNAVLADLATAWT